MANPIPAMDASGADPIVSSVVAVQSPMASDAAVAGAPSGEGAGAIEPGMIPAAAFVGAATASMPGATEPAATTATGSATLDAAAIAGAPRVPFFRRLAALVVDWIPLLFLAAHLPHRFLFLNFDQHAFAVRAVIAVLYFTGMLAWRGTTLGGILFGLRVVRQDGRPMTWEVASVRALSAILSGMTLCLGWFWSQWDPRGQTWHDKLAGTVVVRDDSPQPLV